MSRAVMLRALEALETWRLLQPSTTACAFRDPAIKALCEELGKPYVSRIREGETPKIGCVNHDCAKCQLPQGVGAAPV